MSRINPFFKVLQVLSCLAFALGLILLPPTAAHAHGAIHEAHQVSALQASDGFISNDPMTAKLCVTIKASMDHDAGSGQCCSGVYISVALLETMPTAVSMTPYAHEAYVTPDLLAYDPVGFLRPPKNLI